MTDAEQAVGERRVREMLVEPLLRRGLSRPSNLTKGAFEAMIVDMCKRLAYLTPESLAALEEQAGHHPGGKEKDRFPIANKILNWAADIQPPSDAASGLMRKVFAHEIGRGAVAGGWAPELLLYLRQSWRWPKLFALKTVRDGAGPAIRRMAELDGVLARGGVMSERDIAWRQRRLAAIEKCRKIGGADGEE